MISIRLREEACRGCQMCVEVCPTHVFSFDAAAAKAKPVNADDCFGCLSCAFLCPSQAIVHEGVYAVKNFYRDLEFSRRIARFL
jgi:NAD-dependent dihydropyrimidine dehydrogenase PreA subunit